MEVESEQNASITDEKELAHKRFISNLRANWFLPVSSAALGCVEFYGNAIFWISLIIAVAVVTVFSGLKPPLRRWAARQPIGLRIPAILASLGICCVDQQIAWQTWTPHIGSITMESGIAVDLPLALSLVLAALSFVLVYFGCLYVWKIVWRTAQTIVLADKLSVAEIVIYCFLTVMMMRAAAAAYSSSDAFYGRWDLIYSFDAPSVDEWSVFAQIKNGSNDIKSPLFAVFSAPFTGIPYLISAVFLLTRTQAAVLMDSMQILMLFFSFFSLAQAMRLKGFRRICWVLFCCSTYTCMLFSIVMEQYIIAVFWLSIVVCQACEFGASSPVAVWAASGSTMTSIVCLPLSAKASLRTSPRKWLREVIRDGLGFVALMLALYRFDLLYSLKDSLASLVRFTGQNVEWADKAAQYCAFPWSCLVAAPAQAVNGSPWYGDGWHWLVTPPTGISWPGLVIFVIVTTSSIMNWKKRGTRIATAWVAMSVVVLFLVGWGTAEHSLYLYAWYFAWPFFMLLFQFAEKISEVLHKPWVLPLTSLTASVLMLSVNIPAIAAICWFATEYYPI